MEWENCDKMLINNRHPATKRLENSQKLTEMNAFWAKDAR